MNTTGPIFKTFDDAEIEEVFASLGAQVAVDASTVITQQALQEFDLKWTGRRAGLMNAISSQFRNAPKDRIKTLGKKFNELNEQIKQVKLVTNEMFSFQQGARPLDVTLPGAAQRIGVEHPLVKTMAEIVSVFQRMGYSVGLGPEVETDFYNFEALNFPPNHPARDTQDTLVVAGQETKPLRERLLMRTHTSPVQIRSMLEQAPPLRLVIPGKVHRNDAADATHSPVFHQVEGLCVDTNITFSDLKGTLDFAMKAFFGSAVKTRFFPSFFPFTEPSADVQISCIFCGGKGCRKCKHSGWIELLGCGMVDPAVFESVNQRRVETGREPVYDTRPGRNQISGFAFGMGVDRIAMMKYGISDIGLLYSGDMRFLEQFA
jgi:phenylalanyl-tRNA synthetase alpha chain